MSTGARVVEVHTYPVKSMGAAGLAGADVTPAGLDGDRAWSVIAEDGGVVSARTSPGLREVTVVDVGAAPTLDVPGVAARVAGPDADAALSTYIGAPVRLARVQGSGQEAAAVHLVSRQAVAAAIGTTSDDPACDIETPRANVMLDLGDDPPEGFERAWVGQDVAVGDAVLHVSTVPKHCLGVYAEVVRPGRINLGDSVQPRG
ncbi:MAG: MOSC N-terminal beta barrel domain-containing protein [Actinomycetales bacterium]